MFSFALIDIWQIYEFNVKLKIGNMYDKIMKMSMAIFVKTNEWQMSVPLLESGQPAQPLDRQFLVHELNVVEDDDSASVWVHEAHYWGFIT